MIEILWGLVEAFELSHRLGHEQLGTDHLLVGMASVPRSSVARALEAKAMQSLRDVKRKLYLLKWLKHLNINNINIHIKFYIQFISFISYMYTSINSYYFILIVTLLKCLYV